MNHNETDLLIELWILNLSDIDDRLIGEKPLLDRQLKIICMLVDVTFELKMDVASENGIDFEVPGFVEALIKYDKTCKDYIPTKSTREKVVGVLKFRHGMIDGSALRWLIDTCNIDKRID